MHGAHNNMGNYVNDYTKTLTMKLFLASPDGRGGSNVRLTFDEALELIKEVDRITREIPKIIYLTGWQYNGHDDKYPSWDQVNEALKCRKCGHKTAKDCLVWLMEEARKYHTIISLHINSTDAYMDSPLWLEYTKNHLISKVNGQYMVTGTYNGKDCYQINYRNEWESGYYKKRVDRLLQDLPIQNAGTIHSDAFFCRASDQSTLAEEQAARCEMIRYWRERGVDLTSEFLYGTDEDGETNHSGDGTRIIGLIPMFWHFNQPDTYYMERPASLATGGTPNPGVKYGDDGKNIEILFGRSMWGEDILTREGVVGPTPEWEQRFIDEFCISTLTWAYLNQFERQKLTGSANERKVIYEDNLVTSLSDRSIRHNGILMRQDGDVFIPAAWKEKEMIAYSKNGYEERTWELPCDWKDVAGVNLFTVSKHGLVKATENVKCIEGTLTLTLKAGQMISIQPYK